MIDPDLIAVLDLYPNESYYGAITHAYDDELISWSEYLDMWTRLGKHYGSYP